MFHLLTTAAAFDTAKTSKHMHQTWKHIWLRNVCLPLQSLLHVIGQQSFAFQG